MFFFFLEIAPEIIFHNHKKLLTMKLFALHSTCLASPFVFPKFILSDFKL